ncbi:hypothetical protein BOX15_Mlig013827g5 [Macrostomum lignano]|uniref:Methyltransferase FkbM domain-containing protein n=2 Tax=Macrostomum lignano TaxID=282301 RepID=A0A267FLD4_9PLAT|nr:hypothetical protein BOX15_Mlig013827g2 [Macrostomum lignano]PAA55217.1 hypothetical protein BOX15_Mlig013827g3 [Macrostomum lignano]PAA72466.1 hypothetical protein BOX15_Mlig013827g1 [Macrostomum lignano]PAA73927.1 hypothetical protein BOX15_Mlig013827g5 [Macrostomum lignano]
MRTKNNLISLAGAAAVLLTVAYLVRRRNFADSDTLPVLSDVQLIKNCPAYNELRSVDFTNPSLRHRLCQETPAYHLVRGKFLLCELNRNLPQQMYTIVRQGSPVANVTRAMGGGRMPIFTFGAEDFISGEMLKKNAWETGEIRTMLNLLKQFPTDSVTFLDVGSNVGIYSLQARELGYPVVAIDANIRALARLQMSAKRLDLLDDKLKLFWGFISDDVAVKRITWNADDFGCHAGSGSGAAAGWRQKVTTAIEDTIPVMTVRADELREHISTKNVIIKMDIESGEHLFMKTGEKLFRELNIMALQMEFWRKLTEPPQASKYYNFVTHFMTSRNFSLLSMRTFQVQKITTFGEWDGIWIRNDFLPRVKKEIQMI